MLKTKKLKNPTLSNKHQETKYGEEIFNSTCPPSGNLVDGLPLDLHSRRVIWMQGSIDSYQTLRLFEPGRVQNVGFNIYLICEFKMCIVQTYSYLQMVHCVEISILEHQKKDEQFARPLFNTMAKLNLCLKLTSEITKVNPC